MKKFFSSFKNKNQKAIELRSDFRLGVPLDQPPETSIVVRADLLNLAGASFPSADYLSALKNFCTHFNTKTIHARFATVEHRGIWFFHPVPFVISPKLLPQSIDKIKKLRDALELEIRIENYWWPAKIPNYMREADFFYELVTRAECGFICDLKSSVLSAKAHNENATAQTKRFLELPNAIAKINSPQDFKFLKEFKFEGKTIGSFEGVDIYCEGETS